MLIKEYLDTVCEQIRFEKAHYFVKKELKDHIHDQAQAFVLSGMDKKTALQKAIAEMGDPILVGTELDRVHRPNLEWSFVLFILLFLLANLGMRWTVWKASTATGFPIPSIGINNIISIFIGIAVMIAFYYIDFTILVQRSKMIYAVYVGIVALFSILGNFFGIQGARFVIHISIVHIVVPPLIYLFPVVLIGLLYDCRGRSYTAVLLCGASFLLPALFSFGMRLNTAIFMVAIVSLLLIVITICKGWFAVHKLKMFLLLFIPILLLGLFLYNVPMFAYRLKSFHIGIQDPYGMDWGKNILQQNMKGAHLFGVGESYSFYAEEGNLMQMTPENFFEGAEYFTNYIFHYFGWIVSFLLLGIYLFFIIRGFILAYRQKSQLGCMVAIAILLTILAIYSWNIFCTSGFFIHANPLEMPFFASGGTSNIIYFILMGILLSVFRTGNYVKDGKIKMGITQKFFQLKNGKLIISIPFKK